MILPSAMRSLAMPVTSCQVGAMPEVLWRKHIDHVAGSGEAIAQAISHQVRNAPG